MPGQIPCLEISTICCHTLKTQAGLTFSLDDYIYWDFHHDENKTMAGFF